MYHDSLTAVQCRHICNTTSTVVASSSIRRRQVVDTTTYQLRRCQPTHPSDYGLASEEIVTRKSILQQRQWWSPADETVVLQCLLISGVLPSGVTSFDLTFIDVAFCLVILTHDLLLTEYWYCWSHLWRRSLLDLTALAAMSDIWSCMVCRCGLYIYANCIQRIKWVDRQIYTEVYKPGSYPSR